jgi:hypothetical protein
VSDWLLHPCSPVVRRTMSGSWLAWEFGGGVEAVSKQGAADLVGGAY